MAHSISPACLSEARVGSEAQMRYRAKEMAVATLNDPLMSTMILIGAYIQTTKVFPPESQENSSLVFLEKQNCHMLW
jgi:hypothetical protein